MTEQIAALDALIGAVEAGDRHLCPFWKVWPPESKDGRLAYIADNAFTGSLDAAKALHEALLPGWFPGMSKNIHHGHWYAWVQDKATAHFSAVEPDPARAWLLAIIRALIAQEGGE